MTSLPSEAGGSIAVSIELSGERVVAVDIDYWRPVRVTSALGGRSPQDVLRLVPLLYPICGVAHAVACARAIESALRLPASPGLEAARQAACLAEAAVSHVWQLGLTWREASGATIDPAPLRAARQALLAVCASIFAPGGTGASLRPEPALGDAARGLATLASMLDGLTAAEPPFMATVLRAGCAGFGVAAKTATTPVDVALTGARLASDGGFSDLPTSGGEPLDVSAFARQRSADLVAAVTGAWGPGLLARLAARQAEARADAPKLRACLDALGRGSGEPQSLPLAYGGGVGWADTARGPLVYWVRASPTCVEAVRTVAPTDWTFHPRGVLHDALRGAAASPTFARDARWLVLALDPCVSFTVEVGDA